MDILGCYSTCDDITLSLLLFGFYYSLESGSERVPMVQDVK